MTRKEYHALIEHYDRTEQLIEQAIERIPLNMNRAGKLYQQRVREIRQHYATLT